MKLSHTFIRVAFSLAYSTHSVSADIDSTRDVGENAVVLADGSFAEKILGTIPEQSFTEIHEIMITVEDVPKRPSPRHEREKKSLLKRMSKHHGKWDTNHPRHRLLEALFGFSRYKSRQMTELDRLRGLYKHVTKAQEKLLEKAIGYSKKFDQVEQLINVNQALCDGIVDTALDYYGLSHEELVQHSKAKDKAGQLAEKVSVSQALMHFVRDWSTAGQGEREDAFPCILDTLQSLFPEESRTNVRALFPGSGIGRLAHEVASLGGFEVTMNEWSSFMNIAYRFLETHQEAEMRSFHPFVNSWSHHATTADMLRPVSFPDKLVNASTVLLVEGDFTSIFKHNEGEYDVIVTHFFIDTARNFMAYLDTIRSLLRTGGYWVNCGPLLWGTGPFVQLSLDEIVEVTKSTGFEFLESKKACGGVTLRGEKVRGKKALYGFDSKALTTNAYLAQSWVAKKA